MELNEYQERAMTTCMSTCDNFSYMMLNLVGEVGEFASKVAKAIRKDNVEITPIHDGVIFRNVLFNKMQGKEREKFNSELQKEAGDILWQLSGLCSVMGWDLEDIAQMNLDKLQERKKNGTIDGSGDGVTREERSSAGAAVK